MDNQFVFVIHNKFKEQISLLLLEEKGMLLEAIMAYLDSLEVGDVDFAGGAFPRLVQMLFLSMKRANEE